MSDSFLPGATGAGSLDTSIYLEKDIFFNFHLSRLESPAAAVALNFRECILLRLLLEARVRKQAVIDAAWGDNGVVVTDASYHQLVRSLRKKFEEVGLSAQSIKTLPRFGLEYLREAPPQSLASLSVAEEISTKGELENRPKSGLTIMRRPCAGGMRWPLRVLLLILPFLAGLLIGHLGYRDSAISAQKSNDAPNLEVSVSRGDSEDSPDAFSCETSRECAGIRTSHATSARQPASGSENRFQCT